MCSRDVFPKMWVYPRACGGTAFCLRPRRNCAGLSPRLRGNLILAVSTSTPFGSIPAPAGEPGSMGMALLGQPVYPRACGGTSTCATYIAAHKGLSPRLRGNPCHTAPSPCSTWGLSPRLRGNRQRAFDLALVQRSIPAPAGEPFSTPPGNCATKVYPRACGGTEPRWRVLSLPEGLSPRLRGNPRRVRRTRVPATVYPRACGGTIPDRCVGEDFKGLSPRLRGNLDGRRGEYPLLGSIPAPAGEPRVCQDFTLHPRVYPRACGGTQDEVTAIVREEGLSPRLRGNPEVGNDSGTHQGSIPAPAGEPFSPVPSSVLTGVYPRACGGTRAPECLGSGVYPRACGGNQLDAATLDRGLSPRLRGNLHPIIPDPMREGSIPAPAGEPITRLWSCSATGVYPRACGGTQEAHRAGFFYSGLSPRLRGNR